jgi:hypothetical protein
MMPFEIASRLLAYRRRHGLPRLARWAWDSAKPDERFEFLKDLLKPSTDPGWDGNRFKDLMDEMGWEYPSTLEGIRTLAAGSYDEQPLILHLYIDIAFDGETGTFSVPSIIKAMHENGYDPDLL